MSLLKKHTLLKKQTLCFSSYKNRELKENYDELDLAREKKSAFFVTFSLYDRVFLAILFYLNV